MEVIMKIEKFVVLKDSDYFLGWPDLALAADGRLLCVYNECRAHCDRSHSRIMLTVSHDRGRSWSAPRPLTAASDGSGYYYNCPRLSLLRDGRLAAVVDRMPLGTGGKLYEVPENQRAAENRIAFSDDNGDHWSAWQPLPLRGIVPSKLTELRSGDWLLAAHRPEGRNAEYLIRSGDHGKSWSPEVAVARDGRYELCEASLLELPGGEIAALLRENSFAGYDCLKTVSRDGGASWSPVTALPIPGCHRPVAGLLADGRVLVTYRFYQGGKGGGQNFFAALTDVASLLGSERREADCRLIPIDYDGAEHSDLGYSGWVEFPDGEIYIVSYIVDDHRHAQLRGYAVRW